MVLFEYIFSLALLNLNHNQTEELYDWKNHQKLPMYRLSADFWIICKKEVFYKNSDVLKITIFL